MPESQSPRPVGITIAAVLMMLSVVLTVVLRLFVIPDAPNRFLWIALAIGVFFVAVGLLRLWTWAYWVTVGLVVLAVVMALYRVLAYGQFVVYVYTAARLTILGIWLWYFTRPHVRAAFAVGSVDDE